MDNKDNKELNELRKTINKMELEIDYILNELTVYKQDFNDLYKRYLKEKSEV